MVPSYRTYAADMRVHRFEVSEEMSAYARNIMKSARHHDIDWIRGTSAGMLERNYDSLKEARTYSKKWDIALGEVDPTLKTALYEATSYLPGTSDDIYGMEAAHLVELAADIISWSEIQKTSPSKILDELSAKVSLNVQVVAIIRNTIQSMLNSRR